jgi:hypothetical protein
MKALLWFLQLTPIIAAPWIDLEPRQSGTYAITGIQNAAADDGSVPFRLEIRQLQSNADQWNLYLLALDRLQTVPDQNDPLSHYSISGIHGEPYVSWDGVQATAGNENSGYCTHNSVLFPTWHRPYLALYEVRSNSKSSILVLTCSSKSSTAPCRRLLTTFLLVLIETDMPLWHLTFAFRIGIGLLLLQRARASSLMPLQRQLSL